MAALKIRYVLSSVERAKINEIQTTNVTIYVTKSKVNNAEL